MRTSFMRVLRLADTAQRKPTRRAYLGRLDPLPLALEVIATRGFVRSQQSRKHVIDSRTILLAVAPHLRAHLTLGLRTLRLEAVHIRTRDELCQRMDDGLHAPLVLGDTFDGVSAEMHLIMMRNAGWQPAVVVVGSGHGPLPEIASSLAPVSVVRDPVCDSSPASNPWLRRCIEAVRAQAESPQRRADATTLIDIPVRAAGESAVAAVKLGRRFEAEGAQDRGLIGNRAPAA